MKFFHNLVNKYTVIVLVITVIIAAILHSINYGFPNLNADEATFGYNAWSIAQTGKDEYGKVLPLRFKSFGDNKLPVMFYIIAPFTKIFGLNETSVRLPFMIIGVLTPLLFYFLTLELFKNKNVAIIAAFLGSLSPWIQIMSRHTHEDTLVLLWSILLLIFIIKLSEKLTVKNIVLFSIINGLSLFTYHIGKVLAVYFLIAFLIILFFRRKNSVNYGKALLLFLIPVTFFLFTEFKTPPTRVNNLLFFNNIGFKLQIDELRKEHNSRILHNKISAAIPVLTNRYLSYFSPEFLVMNGDDNNRFGFEGMSPISAVEYLLLGIGLYYLFKNKEKYRFLLLSFLLISPLSASLAWQDHSLTRSFTLIIPILIIAAYGFYNLLKENENKLYLPVIFIIIAGSYLFFTFFTWDFYFNHYPKKRDTIFSWESGYKDLAENVKELYNATDKFYITKRNGQPYIHLLFHMQYSPKKYQNQAALSAPDEYGFGQVERFDKFEFNFKTPDPKENAVYIGYPEDFAGTGIAESDVKKITLHSYEIFWIYNPSSK
jgi:4-amino-4-deoxy-L-arabinose transferase-like glycosyltransferase